MAVWGDGERLGNVGYRWGSKDSLIILPRIHSTHHQALHADKHDAPKKIG